METALNQFNNQVQNIPGFGIISGIYEDKAGDVFKTKDPFYEEIPKKDKRELKPGEKMEYKEVRRRPPANITEKQRKLWKAVIKRAWYHDRNFCGCTPIDLGLGMISIVTIFPIIGAIIAYKMHYKLIKSCGQAGAPPKLIAEMVGNIGVDFMISLVPLLGVLFSWMKSSSTRNAALFDTWLRQESMRHEKTQQTGQQQAQQFEQQVRPPAAAAAAAPARTQGATNGSGTRVAPQQAPQQRPGATSQPNSRGVSPSRESPYGPPKQKRAAAGSAGQQSRLSQVRTSRSPQPPPHQATSPRASQPPPAQARQQVGRQPAPPNSGQSYQHSQHPPQARAQQAYSQQPRQHSSGGPPARPPKASPYGAPRGQAYGRPPTATGTPHTNSAQPYANAVPSHSGSSPRSPPHSFNGSSQGAYRIPPAGTYTVPQQSAYGGQHPAPSSSQPYGRPAAPNYASQQTAYPQQPAGDSPYGARRGPPAGAPRAQPRPPNGF